MQAKFPLLEISFTLIIPSINSMEIVCSNPYWQCLITTVFLLPSDTNVLKSVVRALFPSMNFPSFVIYPFLTQSSSVTTCLKSNLVTCNSWTFFTLTIPITNFQFLESQFQENLLNTSPPPISVNTSRFYLFGFFGGNKGFVSLTLISYPTNSSCLLLPFLLPSLPSFPLTFCFTLPPSFLSYFFFPSCSIDKHVLCARHNAKHWRLKRQTKQILFPPSPSRYRLPNTLLAKAKRHWPN